MERITIYPDKELIKLLKKEAKKEKRSLNNFILFLISKYFGDKNE